MDCGKTCKICNISNKMLLKEINILWNSPSEGYKLENMIRKFFGELRGKKIINAIKSIK